MQQEKDQSAHTEEHWNQMQNAFQEKRNHYFPFARAFFASVSEVILSCDFPAGMLSSQIFPSLLIHHSLAISSNCIAIFLQLSPPTSLVAPNISASPLRLSNLPSTGSSTTAV